MVQDGSPGRPDPGGRFIWPPCAIPATATRRTYPVQSQRPRASAWPTEAIPLTAPRHAERSSGQDLRARSPKGGGRRGRRLPASGGSRGGSSHPVGTGRPSGLASRLVPRDVTRSARRAAGGRPEARLTWGPSGPGHAVAERHPVPAGVGGRSPPPRRPSRRGRWWRGQRAPGANPRPHNGVRAGGSSASRRADPCRAGAAALPREGLRTRKRRLTAWTQSKDFGSDSSTSRLPRLIDRHRKPFARAKSCASPA